MNQVKEALSWIVDLMQRNNITFQIAGGLAMQAYGSSRELRDIDIDIAEEDFDKIRVEVEPFIIFGPNRYKSKNWDLLLMTLNYQGQEVDISGAHNAKIYNKKMHSWERISTDFSKVNIINTYGLNLPIIALEDLIAYKKMLSRSVDLIDVAYLENKLML